MGAHVRDATRKHDDASSAAADGCERSQVIDRVFEGDLTARAVEDFTPDAVAMPTEPEHGPGEAAGRRKLVAVEWAIAVAIAVAAIVAVAILRRPQCAPEGVAQDTPRPQQISAH